MTVTSDEATAQFLAVASDDLQWEIRSAGVVEKVSAYRADDGTVTLTASVRVGRRTTTTQGTGDNLIAAYGDLRRRNPEALLAAAFREVVERP